MTKEASNEYGVPTKEFREAVAPHVRAIDAAVKDLMRQGWADAEIFKALCDGVSLSMSSERIKRAADMRKVKKAAG